MIYNFALLGLLAFVVGMFATVFFGRLHKETTINVNNMIKASLSVWMSGVIFMIICGVIYILDKI